MCVFDVKYYLFLLLLLSEFERFYVCLFTLYLLEWKCSNKRGEFCLISEELACVCIFFKVYVFVKCNNCADLPESDGVCTPKSRVSNRSFGRV